MKNILICFERDKGIVPRIIQWLTNSRVNHVAIVYWSEDWKEHMAYEAIASGVKTRPAGYRTWEQAYAVTKDISDNVRKTKDLLGKKYDVWSLLVFGWILICWRWFKVKVRRPNMSSKAQFCSELVARALSDHIDFEDPQWVHPQELLDICEKRIDLFEVVI